MAETITKDQGWAPGPNARWQRVGEKAGGRAGESVSEPPAQPREQTPGDPEEARRLKQIEDETRAELDRFEAERAQSDNPYKLRDDVELAQIRQANARKAQTLVEHSREAELTSAEQEQLDSARKRLALADEEWRKRQTWYDLQRRLKAAEIGREKGVPVIEQGISDLITKGLRRTRRESGLAPRLCSRGSRSGDQDMEPGHNRTPVCRRTDAA